MRILTEPDASLTAQYKALMATEGVHVEFPPDGVWRIAEIVFQVNERVLRCQRAGGRWRA